MLATVVTKPYTESIITHNIQLNMYDDDMAKQTNKLRISKPARLANTKYSVRKLWHLIDVYINSSLTLW